MRERLLGLPLERVGEAYRRIVEEGGAEAVRWLCRNDRYFLLTVMLGRGADMSNAWCYERCREVERQPDGYLDLWSRGHYKSTIITWAGVIQEILRDPEITVGVLSYNGAVARAFVQQIKQALELPIMVEHFPEIFWESPPASLWGVMRGLWVKRKGQVKEPTVMAGGMVDAQPTGMHFRLRVYDDVVTREAVTTPEQIAKVTEAWEQSQNLDAGDGSRCWMIGTRYHPQDTYRTVLERGAAVERRRVGRDGEGRALLLEQEAWERKREEMGPYVFASQMLQEPTGAGVAMFREEWLMRYHNAPDERALNVYILIDSANAKRKGSDYTTMWVLGLGGDRNYYALDCVRDKMDLRERTRALFRLHRRWRPICVLWEQVGCMSDVEHVREIMDRDNYRFRIAPLGQKVAKQDRIGWLVPLFESGRIWMPHRLMCMGVDGRERDVMKEFVEDEFLAYPVVAHDDMLDALANIKHPAAEFRFPAEDEPRDVRQEAAMWGVRL